jgi:hypothetical protein
VKNFLAGNLMWTMDNGHAASVSTSLYSRRSKMTSGTPTKYPEKALRGPKIQFCLYCILSKASFDIKRPLTQDLQDSSAEICHTLP